MKHGTHMQLFSCAFFGKTMLWEGVNYYTQVPFSKTIHRNWIITNSGGGPMITCGLEPTLFMNKETALSWSR